MAHRNGRPHAPSDGVRAQGRNTLNGSIPHDEWLKIYWKLGFDTVPVEPRSKAVKIDDWNNPNRRFRDPEDYRGHNIGIRLGAVSRRLVDVDLDTPDACAVAPYILPPTRMRMRKQGKPIAHYFYRCTGAAPTHEKWQRRDARDPTERKTVLELRSESREGKPMQTVVPPSVDEDGLEREWINDSVLPDEVDGDALRRACLLTAIAAAVLPHYREGGRHDLALALAGWLRKCHIPEADALRVIEALARATDDPEPDDRRRAVADTYELPIDRVQGWRGLEDLLPPDVRDTLSGWLRAPREADTDTPTRADGGHAERAARAVVEWRGEPPIGTDAHSAQILGDALHMRAAWVDALPILRGALKARALLVATTDRGSEPRPCSGRSSARLACPASACACGWGGADTAQRRTHRGYLSPHPPARPIPRPAEYRYCARDTVRGHGIGGWGLASR